MYLKIRIFKTINFNWHLRYNVNLIKIKITLINKNFNALMDKFYTDYWFNYLKIKFLIYFKDISFIIKKDFTKNLSILIKTVKLVNTKMYIQLFIIWKMILRNHD